SSTAASATNDVKMKTNASSEGVEDDDDENYEDMESDTTGTATAATSSKVYLPGDPLNEDEELIRDDNAYELFHEAQTGNFDIIPDTLGMNRSQYPHTVFIVCGTQAEKTDRNSVMVIKMSNLVKTQKDSEKEEDSDNDDSEDEEEDLKPEFESASLKHIGGVNRIRCKLVGDRKLASTWSETGKVHIWDLTRLLHAVNDSSIMASYVRNQESPKPLFTFNGHTTEGVLVTGDCTKNIHVWKPNGTGWFVDQQPYVGHTGSVEDIQWSPNEQSVFASCSVDKSIRIWDIRAVPSKACMLVEQNAHTTDVNVISWNNKEPFILSGGDDGFIKVWDLRQFSHGTPVASFKHHHSSITSVEWHHTDSSVFAAAGADNQVTLWDLAVEKDDESANNKTSLTSVVSDNQLENLPDQLLFIHMGQTDIKELHWHKQIPGLLVTTAQNGFNVFKTISA
ncbi:unnamed protein product, partial [Didymodactylos carnosus]